MRQARLYSKPSLFLDWTNILLSLTNHLQRVQKCAASLSDDTHSQRGTYKINFVPAALASRTFEINVQTPVSHHTAMHGEKSAPRLRNKLPNHLKRTPSKDIL